MVARRDVGNSAMVVGFATYSKHGLQSVRHNFVIDIGRSNAVGEKHTLL